LKVESDTMPFKGLVLSKTGKIGGRLGIEIEEGKGISGREILYYGLSEFEKPAAFTPFLLRV
jgi:hypothetical protein